MLITKLVNKNTFILAQVYYINYYADHIISYLIILY